MWTYHDGIFWGMNWIWWIIWVLFIIWIIFMPFGWGRRSTRDNAIEILRDRYARGEITKTEFEALKKDLQN